MSTTIYLNPPSERKQASDPRTRPTISVNLRRKATLRMAGPRVGELVRLSADGKPIESFAEVTRVLSGVCETGNCLVQTSDGRVRAVGPADADRDGASWVAL